MSYLGKAPGAPGGVRQVYEFVATANQTTFSGVDRNGAILAYEPGFANVFVGGVMLSQTDVTASSGSSIVLPYGLQAGKIVQIEAFGTFKVADALPISGGTLTGYVNGITAARGDYSTKLATTEFVQRNGLAYRPGGMSIGSSTTLTTANLNGWGQIQAAGVTVTLPGMTADGIPNGMTFTLMGGSQGGTLKAATGEVIVDPLGTNGNTFYVAPNEVITVVSNGGLYGWFVIGASGRGVGSFRSEMVVNSSTTLTAASAGQLIVASAAFAFTTTLPLAGSVPAGTQIAFSASTATGGWTVQRQGADVLDNMAGNTSLILYTSETAVFESNGAGCWRLVGGNAQLRYARDFGSSLATGGYQRLPSGLILQWGWLSDSSWVANTGRAITYPIAFPNACLQNYATSANAGYWAGAYTDTSRASKTGLTAYMSQGGTQTFVWFAIGY